MPPAPKSYGAPYGAPYHAPTPDAPLGCDVIVQSQPRLAVFHALALPERRALALPERRALALPGAS